MSRAHHGCGAPANILNLLIITLGRDLLTLGALFCVMLWQDPVLTVLGLLVMPLAAIGVIELVKRANLVASRQFAGGHAMMQHLQETIQGIKVIKSFTVEDRMRERMAQEIAGIAIV